MGDLFVNGAMTHFFKLKHLKSYQGLCFKVFGGAVLLALTTCGPVYGSKKSGLLSASGLSEPTQCYLPYDQKDTLIARWAQTPVPLSISIQGGFSSAELQAITNAVNTWNSFYEKSHGFPLFRMVSTFSVQSLPLNETACSTFIANQSGFFEDQSVVIYKPQVWKISAEGDQNILIRTNLCKNIQVPSKPLLRFNMAYIEVNENFFFPGTAYDFESSMLHELGHVAGLDHTCGDPSSKVIPDCSDPVLPKEYEQAIMYPEISPAKIKRNLNGNDKLRANCLYSDFS